MNVFGLATDSLPYNDPFPQKSGVIFRLLGGMVIRPWDGNWLKEPYPTQVGYWNCKLPILPFLSVKIGRFGFYIGFKCFNLGHEQYKEWMDKGIISEFGENHYALTPSMRWTNGSDSV